MNVTALLMAGGRGTRMMFDEEKPLIKLGSKHLIEYVLDALMDSKRIDKIVVAVSKHTPKTASILRGVPVQVLETPGKGYVFDLQFAIKALNLEIVLVISADLPFVVCEAIDEVIEFYEKCGKPALTVAVPEEIYRMIGIEPDYSFKLRGRDLVPIGINIIDGRKIDEGRLEEEVFIISMKEISINVNDIYSLDVAKQFLRTHKEGLVNG